MSPRTTGPLQMRTLRAEKLAVSDPIDPDDGPGLCSKYRGAGGPARQQRSDD